MLLKATNNFIGVADCHTGLQISRPMKCRTGGNFYVQVSLDFASAGIYAAQYAIKN